MLLYLLVMMRGGLTGVEKDRNAIIAPLHGLESRLGQMEWRVEGQRAPRQSPTLWYSYKSGLCVPASEK